MRINVPDIPAEGIIIEMNTPSQNFPELKQLAADGECQFKGDIFTHLEIRKVADIVEVTGRIETKTISTCSRCLAVYEAPVAHHFSVDFTHESPEPDVAGGEIALSEEDLGLIYYKGDTIDFHDAIQEQVILSLPLRPLCREDCKGLCHNCGENLNEGNCRCSSGGIIDPRFAVLGNLKLPPVKK
ncbi:MAG: DUF177 domain-containing protein [Pseudomonadota bacterium]